MVGISLGAGVHQHLQRVTSPQGEGQEAGPGHHDHQVRLTSIASRAKYGGGGGGGEGGEL